MRRFRRRSLFLLLGLALLAFGCPEEKKKKKKRDAGVDVGDTAPFDMGMPDTAVEDTAVGDMGIPDTAAGDTAVGDTAVGDTMAADTMAADTTRPDAADTAVADVADTAADTAPAPDAPTGDIGDAPGGASSLILLQGQAPVPGVDVIFHDSTGGVIGQGVTDNAGRVSQVVPPDAMATLVFDSIDEDPELATMAGIQPGDQITFQVPFESDVDTVGQVTVNLPGAFSGALAYQVSIGCNTVTTFDPTQPVTIDILDSCPQDGDLFDVVAVAATPPFDEPNAHAVATDVSRNTTGTTNVDLTSWGTTFSEKTLTITNKPSPSTTVLSQFWIVRNNFPSVVGSRMIPLPGSSGSTTFIYPPNFAEFVSYQVTRTEGQPGSGPQAASFLTDRIQESSADTITVDLQDDLLPLMQSINVDSANAARPSVSWSFPGNIGRVDLGVMTLAWDASPTRQLEWVVFFPPSNSGPFQFPSLPSSQQSLVPTNPQSYEVGLGLGDFEQVAGYDEFKGLVSSDFVEGAPGALRTEFSFIGSFSL